MSEEDKYTLMWAQPEYRTHSPGEIVASSFLNLVRPSGKVIDFGCGSGKGSLKLAEYGCDVLCVDFAENSRDAAAEHLPFLKHDLREMLPEHVFAKYGFCTDEMELLQTEYVRDVIQNIMECVEVCFCQISTIQDTMGELIGQELHLTVHPHGWWGKLFQDMGYKISWAEEQDIAALFIITN